MTPPVMEASLLFIVTVVKTEHFFDVPMESCAKMEILIMVFIHKIYIIVLEGKLADVDYK